MHKKKQVQTKMPTNELLMKSDEEDSLGDDSDSIQIPTIEKDRNYE